MDSIIKTLAKEILENQENKIMTGTCYSNDPMTDEQIKNLYDEIKKLDILKQTEQCPLDKVFFIGGFIICHPEKAHKIRKYIYERGVE